MSNTQLDARRRAQVFAELESRTFDLAVIGGGITGAGYGARTKLGRTNL